MAARYVAGAIHPAVGPPTRSHGGNVGPRRGRAPPRTRPSGSTRRPAPAAACGGRRRPAGGGSPSAKASRARGRPGRGARPQAMWRMSSSSAPAGDRAAPSGPAARPGPPMPADSASSPSSHGAAARASSALDSSAGSPARPAAPPPRPRPPGGWRTGRPVGRGQARPPPDGPRPPHRGRRRGSWARVSSWRVTSRSGRTWRTSPSCGWSARRPGPAPAPPWRASPASSARSPASRYRS